MDSKAANIYLPNRKQMFSSKALQQKVPPRSEGLAPGEQRSYLVPMVSRALNIMNMFTRTHRNLTAQQIMDTTGYSRSSVYRILRTLAAHGYIRDDDRGGFTYGAAMKFIPHP